MTSKEEALFTHERILNISGTPNQCKLCTRLVLHKLADQDEIAPFLNKGTTYSSPLGVGMGVAGNQAFRGVRNAQPVGAPRGKIAGIYVLVVSSLIAIQVVSPALCHLRRMT